MIHEYAVDPGILSDYQSCRAFIEAFRERPTRRVGDAPRKWIQEALYALSSLEPVKRKTIKEHLMKLSKSAIVSNRTVQEWDHSGTTSWESYAGAENATHAFSAVLVSEETARYGNVYPFDNIGLDCPDCWSAPSEIHVPRRAKDMVAAILPLLRISRRLLLVDPFFSLVGNRWSRYRPFLSELLAHSGEFNFGRGVATIEIHTSDEYGDMSHQLQAEMRKLAVSVDIKVSHWPKRGMHDRFVLTDVGGVFFGPGLDEDTTRPDALVSVLSHSAYRKELAKVEANPLMSYREPPPL